ncbi:MAG: acyl--CoA ligase [Acidimicrobiales bacterium]|nr:acyl--CoA ligase [Acidimicrobiales bacterium]
MTDPTGLDQIETIPELLAARRADSADVRAIVADATTLTYAQLDDASAVVAARLIEAGVVKGDRVALLALNTADWAVIAFGVMRMGAVLVPLSTLLRSPELAEQLRVAGVSQLIAAPEVRGRSHLDELDAVAPGYRDALAGGRRHAAIPSLRGTHFAGDLTGPEAAPPSATAEELVQAMEDRIRPADDMVVLFTSGSTSTPKGVIHTHGGGLRATANGLGVRCVGPGDRLYIPMPMFWTGGFSSGLITTALAGATLLTEAEPEPEGTLKLLEREQVTLFRGWPDQAAKLAAQPAFSDVDLSSLTDASLGALLPADRRPEPGARPNLFGMTESFGPYCSDRLDVDMPREKWGSSGRPLPGVEVRITDPDAGVPCAAGDEGEIWLRGPNILRGICGRDRSEVFTADGWFRTGDRGVIDADGYLWYRGRLDDMFKVKGATVYPSEVEGALRALPSVRQAYVTAVTVGSSTADGEREGSSAPLEVAAAVITDDSVDHVRAAVKDRLSAFKVPTRWLITTDPGDVPMTATGKVDKRALRALIENDSPSNDS